MGIVIEIRAWYFQGAYVDSDRSPVKLVDGSAVPGSATSRETMAETEELALRRAAELGKPVIVTGFSASGLVRVHDVDPEADDIVDTPHGRQEGMTATERQTWRQSAEGKQFTAALNAALKQTSEDPPPRLVGRGTVKVTPSKPLGAPPRPWIQRLRPGSDKSRPRVERTAARPRERRARSTSSGTRASPSRSEPLDEPPPARRLGRCLRRLLGGGK